MRLWPIITRIIRGIWLCQFTAGELYHRLGGGIGRESCLAARRTYHVQILIEVITGFMGDELIAVGTGSGLAHDLYYQPLHKMQETFSLQKPDGGVESGKGDFP